LTISHTCGQISGLIVHGDQVAVKLRSAGNPRRPLDLSVYQDGVRLATSRTGRRWIERTFHFDEHGQHTLLFVVEGIVDEETEGLSLEQQKLKIQVLTPGAWIIPHIRLFDLDADPDEMEDAAADEIEMTGVLFRELAGRLVRENLVAPPELVIYSEKHRQRLEALGYLE
jgi:hypothetical protein